MKKNYQYKKIISIKKNYQYTIYCVSSIKTTADQTTLKTS